jgi:hypothetical protein
MAVKTFTTQAHRVGYFAEGDLHDGSMEKFVEEGEVLDFLIHQVCEWNDGLLVVMQYAS